MSNQPSDRDAALREFITKWAQVLKIKNARPENIELFECEAVALYVSVQPDYAAMRERIGDIQNEIGGISQMPGLLDDIVAVVQADHILEVQEKVESSCIKRFLNALTWQERARRPNHFEQDLKMVPQDVDKELDDEFMRSLKSYLNCGDEKCTEKARDAIRALIERLTKGNGE